MVGKVKIFNCSFTAILTICSWSAGFFPTLEKKVLSTGNSAPQKIKVLQAKEPPHYIKLFDGMIVVHAGKRKDNKKLSKPQLYHVRNSGGCTRAIQISTDPTRLNSIDSFIVYLASKVLFLWHGKLASSARKVKAKSIQQQQKFSCLPEPQI